MTLKVKPRLDLYRKYVYFLKAMYHEKGKYFRKIEVEFRTYLAHILYSDIADLLKLEKRNLLLDVGGARGEFCKVLKEEYHWSQDSISVFLDKVLARAEKNRKSIGEKYLRNRFYALLLYRG